MAFSLRLSATGALAATLALGLAGCATRRPELAIEIAPVAAATVWRLEPGDLLKTRVFRSPDLSAEPTVSADGSAYFPALGRLRVSGLTIDSLETELNVRYSTLLRGDPGVQVSMSREITFYGQVRAPGIYAMEPGTTLLGLVARAGGQTGALATPTLTLETSEGRRFLLPRGARLGGLDVHRTDAIYLAEEGFFLRNASTIGATTVVVQMLSTLVGLLVLVSR
jgi:protein involved in polysaccharide export with SLBB domain